MWHVPSLSTSKFLDFIAPIDVKYAGPENMNMLHDVMGIITNVFKIRRFPFACRERETNYEARYVKFTITDNMEKKMTGIVVGKLCEWFVNHWARRTSSIMYNYDPIVAVLNNWRITDYHGKNVLMSEYGFSKFYINPTFEDVDISLYIRGYMLEDDKDDVMVEVVEEN
ncbi:hypothetical protein AXX17_ATUG00710 [Arabidopsis thaliana]|uniref:Uncharacterized protein n=2 Tax=Arabidopsis TaxID=3701 RepID=A0A178U9V7_ARATH|nr:hypothetical protein AXX17_ATUG00710 [Arabidopsis thaliana]